MKIKRFFAADIREAMRQVREEQGPDAVILSNRTIEGGVEIVAAVDYDEALVSDLAAGAAPARTRPAPSRPEPGTARLEWSQDPALVQMRAELQAVRGLLEHELSGLAWGEMARRHPQRTRLMQMLLAAGFAPALAQRVAERVPEGGDLAQARRLALGLLARHLPLYPHDLLNHGGVVALLGPTGVGKTTTVAKLAARFTLRHGASHVALVTTDNYRIGAHEQLHTYSKVLDVPMRVARTRDELAATLNSLEGRRLVLIDTAGMSQRDLRLAEQFALIRDAGPAITPLLVLSATTQLQALLETVEAFGRVRPAGCILTKLDEATQLGAALSAVIQRRLPVAFVSDGQRVPEDLQPARAHGLISRGIALTQQAARRGRPLTPEFSAAGRPGGAGAVSLAMALGARTHARP